MHIEMLFLFIQLTLLDEYFVGILTNGVDQMNLVINQIVKSKLIGSKKTCRVNVE